MLNRKHPKHPLLANAPMTILLTRECEEEEKTVVSVAEH